MEDTQVHYIINKLKENNQELKAEIKTLVELKLTSFKEQIFDKIDSKINVLAREVCEIKDEVKGLKKEVEKHDIEIDNLKERTLDALDKPFKKLFYNLVIFTIVAMTGNIGILALIIYLLKK